MSSEQNVPEVQAHQGPPPASMNARWENGRAGCRPNGSGHGMGQSKSSRDADASGRTKARSGTGSQAAPQTAGDVQACRPECAFGPAPAGPTASPVEDFSSRLGPSTKRWKKKFRDRDRHRGGGAGKSRQPGQRRRRYSNGGRRPIATRDTHQPGNKAGGFKRKSVVAVSSATAAPAALSGPWTTAIVSSMATSPIPRLPRSRRTAITRAATAMAADAATSAIRSPSTTRWAAPSLSRRRADQDLLLHRRPVLQREDHRDRTQARRQGGVREGRQRSHRRADREDEDAERPGLIVFDLNNANAKPLTLIPKLKAKLKKTHLDHRFPLAPAGRSEGQGCRGGLRHGDAARRLLAEPAQPSAPLWSA